MVYKGIEPLPDEQCNEECVGEIMIDGLKEVNFVQSINHDQIFLIINFKRTGSIQSTFMYLRT